MLYTEWEGAALSIYHWTKDGDNQHLGINLQPPVRNPPRCKSLLLQRTRDAPEEACRGVGGSPELPPSPPYSPSALNACQPERSRNKTGSAPTASKPRQPPRPNITRGCNRAFLQKPRAHFSPGRKREKNGPAGKENINPPPPHLPSARAIQYGADPTLLPSPFPRPLFLPHHRRARRHGKRSPLPPLQSAASFSASLADSSRSNQYNSEGSVALATVPGPS